MLPTFQKFKNNTNINYKIFIKMTHITLTLYYELFLSDIFSYIMQQIKYDRGCK